MKRITLNLPDQLHLKLQQLSDRRQQSIEDVIARALDVAVQHIGSRRAVEPTWRLPDPMDLGPFLAPVDRWRELAYDLD